VLTEAQLVMRKTMITGSDITAIVGADPSRGPFDCFVEKVEGWVRTPTGPMEGGMFLEPGVGDWYLFRHPGRRFVDAPGTIRHPTMERVGCTPDRLVAEEEQISESQAVSRTFDLSIKVPTPFGARFYGEPGTDDIPLHNLLQLQWELIPLRALDLVTTGYCELAAPIDGDLRVYQLKEDRELQEMLLDAGARFWKDHIEPKVPPPLDGSKVANQWLAKRFPTKTTALLEATLDDEVLGLELKEACAAYDVAEKRKELAKQRLKERIGENAGLLLSAGKCTWKTDKRGRKNFRHPFKNEE
jgi:predicted phage-related endonuclease